MSELSQDEIISRCSALRMAKQDERIAQLEAENKRLREALEETLYRMTNWITEPDETIDKARRALQDTDK